MLEFQHRLRDLTIDWTSNGSMTPMERLVITGYTNEGDKKHKSLNPAHKVLKPYPVPNFKLHSLTNTQITNKEMPPIRLIASSRNGPTYKLGKWLSGILTPLSIEYCGEEYIRDSAHFLTKLNNQSYPPDKEGLCFTVDVNKLYPSITETLVMESLDHALSQSKISVPRRLTIKKATSLCINNAFLHYRGNWVVAILGIPTGGPESSSLANIAMRYFLLMYKDSVFFQEHFSICLILLWRFLDDIFGLWFGDEEVLKEFINSLNQFGVHYGLSFKYEFGKSVSFLDVLVEFTNNQINTSIYVKPTDSPNLLNRGSFASPHIFKSLPFSQFRRAVVLCSTTSSRDAHFDRIYDKLVDNGYSKEELREARERALTLDRSEILDKASSSQSSTPTSVYEYPFCIITFVTTFNYHCKLFKTLFKELENDLFPLIGDHRIIVSERRNPNLKDLLFVKKRFTEEEIDRSAISHPCHRNCKTCPMVYLNGCIVIDGIRLILYPDEGSCIMEDIVYIAYCMVAGCNDFYIGHTINRLRDRCSGHRGSFKPGCYKKSALAYHIFNDHPEVLSEGLNNFAFGVLKQVDPRFLADAENLFIVQFKADTKHLNRYKALRFD